MSILTNPSRQPHRKVRGREKRTVTLNTKLTESEFGEIEKSCDSRGVALSEWVRDVVLREARTSVQPDSSPLFGEIAGVRLLLINTLEPLLRGEKMSPDQFKEMLRYVKTNKRKAAADMLASYAEGTTD